MDIVETKTVTVDYGLTLEEMIKKGSYFVVGIASEHFSIDGSGTVETKLLLFCFDHLVTAAEVLREFGSQGVQPAKIEHLLAYGAQYLLDNDREEDVVALGSVWADDEGSRKVPVINMEFDRVDPEFLQHETNLQLHPYEGGGGWLRGQTKFLALGK